MAAEQPDLTFGQTTAKLGAMWKALADEEKLVRTENKKFGALRITHPQASYMNTSPASNCT